MLGLGFAAVIKGADFLVDGASALAKKFGVSELTIGLSVVAFGTSAPELAVNLQANDEIVFGNIIGSNNFNLLAILGIAGLIYPLKVRRKTLFIQLPLSALVLGLLMLLVNDRASGGSTNVLGTFEAIFLLLLFAGFIFYLFRSSRKEILSEVEGTSASAPILKTLLLVILGIAGLALGGQLVVDNASDIASNFGVSDTLISLTIVSLGTSLPELATTAVAALKKRPDLAVGNVVGSNIFNVLLILGVSALVSPRAYQSYLNVDILITIGTSVLLFLFILLRGQRTLGRLEAVGLLLIFVFYLGLVMNRELHFF